ncbi:hypothetical protein H0H87_010094 [Tephrocybe sp. NHM501043]|nr:hypothetical protein H0H87_010094 [Tephrocybe sp. NHM501043]
MPPSEASTRKPRPTAASVTANRVRAPSTSSSISSIARRSRSPNATPMPRQSLSSIPSLARSQPPRRISAPLQQQVFPKASAPKTPSPPLPPASASVTGPRSMSMSTSVSQVATPPRPRARITSTPHRPAASASLSVAGHAVSLASPSPRRPPVMTTPSRSVSITSTSTTGSNSVFGPSPAKAKPKATPSRPTPKPTPTKSIKSSSTLSLSKDSDKENAFPGPAVPWQHGALSLTNGAAGGGGDALSLWGETDDMDMELFTDVGDADVDEELTAHLASIAALHSRKITHLKRLLERAQASAAAQLHALQAEVGVLRASGARGIANGDDDDDDECDVNDVLIRALTGTKKGSKREFSEPEVRRALRRLGRAERMRLMREANGKTCAAGALPGDIPLQLLLLQKYQKSTFDVLGRLSVPLAVRVLRELGVRGVVGVRGVCKKWRTMVDENPALWRWHCMRITRRDPVRLNPPAMPEGWYPLYRSLHHRESNFAHALPQTLRLLAGHTNFCTTLLLRGKRLISGSYDETIRFWDLSPQDGGAAGGAGAGGGREVKCLRVKKPVSCVDWLVEEEVFVVGFHDVGLRAILPNTNTNTNPLTHPQPRTPLLLFNVHAAPTTRGAPERDPRGRAVRCEPGERGRGQGARVLGLEEGREEGAVWADDDERYWERREMISQFRLAELGVGNAELNSRLWNVGTAPNNMLQWFAAKGTQMTCATKSVIIHLQWQEGDDEDKAPNVVPIAAPALTATSPTTTTTALRSSLARSTSSLSTSTTGAGISTPPAPARRISLVPSSHTPLSLGSAGGTKSRLSLNTSINHPSPRTPVSISNATSTNGGSPFSRVGTPLSASASASASRLGRSGGRLAGTPLGALFPVRYGRAAILTAPPTVVAVVETPDVAVGAVDPRKRRVVTATRFSSRAGADRRIFMSTHRDKDKEMSGGAGVGEGGGEEEEDEGTIVRDPAPPRVDIDTDVRPLGGAWTALANGGGGGARGLLGALPPGFAGLATPEKNPMSMQLSHEEVVVGCADGTI